MHDPSHASTSTFGTLAFKTRVSSLLKKPLIRLAALIIAIAIFVPGGIPAQANHDPSTPVQTVYSVNFSSSDQSQLGPGSIPSFDLTKTFQFIDEEWDESDTSRDVWHTEVDVPGWVTTAFGVEDFGADFGGEVSGASSGQIDAEFGIRNFGKSVV